jgi:hypothetical protein
MSGDSRRAWPAALVLVGLLATAAFLGYRWLPTQPLPVVDSNLSGVVLDDQGPVAGATVRFKAQAFAVTTDEEGRFHLPKEGQTATRITASKSGYLIAGTAADSLPLTLQLSRLPAEDSEDYVWEDPTPGSSAHPSCGNCHSQILEEWSASGHARSVQNRHFLNLYDGSDWSGRHPAGWNLLAEHPDGAGVCTACHAPSIGFSDPAFYDLRQASGAAAHGVHCDFCHKIAGVNNDQFGLTHGRFGLKLLRPAKGRLFFGPLDDVDRGEDAYASLYRDSRYCASCHEGTVFGVPVYTTYSEWLASPARTEGQQCQSCHMKPTGQFTNIAQGRGGIARDPQSLANHRFFDGSQRDMLRRSLNVGVRVIPSDPGSRVEVTVLADKVGHRVPTGFVDRHLILVVEAFTSSGKAVRPEAVSCLLPAIAGKSVSGLAGRLYGKQLTDFEGRRPVPFWLARPEVVDTRLVPGVADQSSYSFPEKVARLRVRLLYRKFWEQIANQKGWPDNEMVILDQTGNATAASEIHWSCDR